MPLSDREKRLLEEMEAALLTEDPGLVLTLTGGGLHPNRTRVLTGVGVVFAGIAVLFGGLISQTPIVGVFGFLITLTGVIIGITAISHRGHGGGENVRLRKKRNLNAKLEERWDRRNNDPQS